MNSIFFLNNEASLAYHWMHGTPGARFWSMGYNPTLSRGLCEGYARSCLYILRICIGGSVVHGDVHVEISFPGEPSLIGFTPAGTRMKTTRISMADI